MSQNSIFSDFTNLYSITKTLKFELKPVGKTLEYMESNGIIANDTQKEIAYKALKPYFDRFHREFISKALARGNSYIDYSEFYESFVDIKKKKIEKSKLKKDTSEERLLNSEINNIQKNIEKWQAEKRKMIVQMFNSEVDVMVAPIRKELGLDEKKAGLKLILNSGTTLPILRAFFGSDKDAVVVSNLVAQFDKFGGYFDSFLTTRENLYSEKDQATAISNRIINENLLKFANNKYYFEYLNDSVKELLNLTDEELSIFELWNYNGCFSESGISRQYHNDIETISESAYYNIEPKGYNTIIAGINTKINQYNQGLGQTEKPKTKIKQLLTLHKQILSQKESWLKTEINNDLEVITVLNVFVEDQKINVKKAIELMDTVGSNEDELSGIFIKSSSLNTISRRWFGQNWNWFELNLPHSETKIKQKTYKLKKFISLAGIKNALDSNLVKNYENTFGEKIPKKQTKKQLELQTKIEISLENLLATEVFGESIKDIISDDLSLWQNFINIWKSEFEALVHSYELENNKIKTILKLQTFQKNKIVEDGLTQGNLVKNYADSCLKVYQMMKYFALEDGKKNVIIDDASVDFYNKFDLYYSDNSVVHYYNEFRNYLTKKPFDNKNKLKLNFQNPTLLAGWSLSKEQDNWSSILRDDAGKYYLAITSKGNNNIFSHQKNPNIFQGQGYSKLEYNLLTDVSRSIPKCTTQLKKVIIHFKESNTDYIFENKKQLEKFRKGFTISKKEFELNNKIYLKTDLSKCLIRDKESKEDEKNYVKIFQVGYILPNKENIGDYKQGLIEWIDFCKKFIKFYINCEYFDFSCLKDSSEYNDINDFYGDVDKSCYTKKFVPINKNTIDDLVQAGKLYLFQIHNKDWLESSKGSKNLQTMYWESMFSTQNIKNTVIKLNGEAEVFLRDTQIKEKVIRGTTPKFNHDIITNSRYTVPKIQFHVPITMNFAKNNEPKIKELITNNANKFNIIGIDRGEKHLAYYSIIDQNGNLIECESLNVINGIDYAQKLQDREDERLLARENWESISKIKELKEGYIAQVITKICELMIEHNAIVVFENLNSGFKNGRKKIEKSIYQKLETALVNKLSYYVRKSELNTLNAYQLTPKASSYADIELIDWFGSVFFTTANYTSSTCPCCGFRKRLYLKDNENLKEKFSNIKIGFDNQEYSFEYDTKNTNSDLAVNNKVFCNNLTSRYLKSKNELGIWETKDIKIFDKLNELFERYEINITLDINLALAKIKVTSKFWKELLRIFNLLTQLRNSWTEKNIDAIRCPSCGFETIDNNTNKIRNIELIKDADANGAYNIARKGILMLKKIEQTATLTAQTKPAKLLIPSLYVSDSQWDEYTLS